MEDLQDDVMDTIHDYYAVPGHIPNVRDVEYIYQNTTPASKMRPLLRVRCVFQILSGEAASQMEWGDILITNGEIGHEKLLN